MKYIRTKDGRIVAYGTEEDSGYSKGRIRIQNKPKISATMDPIEILKEADAIEELCDEVVYVREGYDNTSENIHLFKKRNRSMFHEELAVYGAIWTDVGLIYVAKMNGKGEFELL